MYRGTTLFDKEGRDFLSIRFYFETGYNIPFIMKGPM